MDDCTYILEPDVLGTLRLVRTTPDGRTIPWAWGLTPGQWRAVLATLPAEDGKSDAPAEDSIAEKLARVTAERDELLKIVQGYQDARERLIWRAEAASIAAFSYAQMIRQCAEAAKRRADEIEKEVASARALPLDPRTSEAADVVGALDGDAS